MSFVRLIALTVLAGGILTDAVSANCRSEIDAAQKRLTRINDGNDDDRKNSSPPEEDWFSTRTSSDGAKSLLENARKLAREGEEEGCRSHVRQAERIILGLETKKPGPD